MLGVLWSELRSDFRLHFTVVLVRDLVTWMVVEISAHRIRGTRREGRIFLRIEGKRCRVACEILPWYIVVNCCRGPRECVLVHSVRVDTVRVVGVLIRLADCC